MSGLTLGRRNAFRVRPSPFLDFTRVTMSRFLVAAALALCGCVSASAQDAPWRVGVAEVKVTPEMPVVMSGYGGRTKPFEKVAADLYVKAMVLDDGSGQRGV